MLQTPCCSKVWFTECSSINSGRGGFKILGGEPASPQNYHEDIWLTDCLVEDAGQLAMLQTQATLQRELTKGGASSELVLAYAQLVGALKKYRLKTSYVITVSWRQSTMRISYRPRYLPCR